MVLITSGGTPFFKTMIRKVSQGYWADILPPTPSVKYRIRLASKRQPCGHTQVWGEGTAGCSGLQSRDGLLNVGLPEAAVSVGCAY